MFLFLINLFVIRWLFLKTIRFRTRLPSAVFLISTIWAIIKLFFSRFWTELTPCVFFISSFDRWPVTVPRWITMSYYFLKLVSSFELKRILVNSLGAFNLCTSYKFILIILRAVWRWNLSQWWWSWILDNLKSFSWPTSTWSWEVVWAVERLIWRLCRWTRSRPSF